MQVDSLRFKSGDQIFREGDSAHCMYLITKGTVSIRKNSHNAVVEIAQIQTHQIFGEIAFFDKSPRSADAVACGQVELIEIPYEKLEPFFNAAPDYLKKIILSLAQRLRDADNMILTLKEEAESRK